MYCASKHELPQSCVYVTFNGVKVVPCISNVLLCGRITSDCGEFFYRPVDGGIVFDWILWYNPFIQRTIFRIISSILNKRGLDDYRFGRTLLTKIMTCATNAIYFVEAQRNHLLPLFKHTIGNTLLFISFLNYFNYVATWHSRQPFCWAHSLFGSSFLWKYWPQLFEPFAILFQHYFWM